MKQTDTVNMAAGLSRRGNKALYSGDMTNAVDCFKRALYLDAYNKEYLIDLIFALNQLARFDESVQLGYAALGISDPGGDDLSVLYFLIAEALIGNNLYDCCVRMLEASLAANDEGPCSEDARQMLQDLKNAEDEDEEEGQDYGEYRDWTMPLSAAPAMPTAKKNGGEDEGAVPYGHPLQYLMNINRLIQEEKNEQALEAAEAAAENDAGILPVICYGIMLSVKTGNKEKREYFKKLLENMQDCEPEDLHMLADTLSILDQNKTAYHVFKKLYGMNKFNNQILYGFAVACLRAGEDRHARELLRALDLLEGGDGIGAALLHMLEQDVPAQTLGYVYQYTDAYAREVWNMLINSGRQELSDRLETDRAFFHTSLWILRTQPEELAEFLLDRLPPSRPFQLLEMRKIAADMSVSMLTRVNAAEWVARFDAGRVVFVHTGTDYIPYSMELHQVVRQIWKQEMDETNSEIKQ